MSGICAIEALPKNQIGSSDIPVSAVVDGMQLLYSCIDSSLELGICKLSLCCMLQILPRVYEQLHVHLHAQSRQQREHMSGVTRNKKAEAGRRYQVVIKLS